MQQKMYLSSTKHYRWRKTGHLRTNHEYTDECKKQLSYSTFYKQTDESNLQKQNTKLRNEIMNLKASNTILEKE